MAASDAITTAADVQLDFVTMGMFIIDEIHFTPPREPEIDILGGAGSWSILGARLFREPPASRQLGWIVHKGSDFPRALDDQIRSWDTSCNLIDTPQRLTTRGWNGYGDDEARAFKYTTPKLRIDETQLSDEQMLAKCFHLICTPTRCKNLVEGISKRRSALLGNGNGTQLETSFSKPIFVWEPVPDACTPEEFENALEALQYVDVVSPNHQELAAFFNEPSKLDEGFQDVSRLRSQCERLMKGWSSKKGIMVVRCGEQGCFWMDEDSHASSMKPYHRAGGKLKGLGSPEDVIDPTGAGNAFLGGFCAALVDAAVNQAERTRHAVQSGLVAASFAIEQVGLPRLSNRHGQELWNEDVVRRRLQALIRAEV